MGKASHNNSERSHFFVGILLAVFFFAGWIVHSKIANPLKYIDTVSNKESVLAPTHDFSIFWETWKTLEDKYPFDEDEPNLEERIYAATSGMVDSFGDPHTSFLSPEDTQYFAQEVVGEFSGVGMEVGVRENLITVVAPLKGSPAETAGVLPGDVIYKVDEEEVFDMHIDEVIKLIRGEQGSTVKLTLLREREAEPIEIDIVRDNIEIPVSDYFVRDNTFVIELYSFNAHAVDAVKEALKAFKDSDAEYVILDLRSNPGGFLEASVDIASMFLPEGALIVTERSTKVEDIAYRSSGKLLLDESVPMVVLVDTGSASASEILAGALQEHGRAELVGTQTFGKGSVQEFLLLSDKSSLKVTVAKWFTPNGLSISDGGLTPDHTVELDREAYEAGEDTQLKKALELLAEKG